MLELNNISRQVDGEVLLEDVSLRLVRGEINILLGPTLAGKTSLMRVMAGLDKPDAGQIEFDGESVLGVPVRQRNVAMVYQQFINYPNFNVYENIASPLRVAKIGKAEIDSRVREVASLLSLTSYLERTPDELSGGQQQRVALARAIIKRAQLVLLDEPLANLDYKLREELRSELPVLFAELGVVLVYATTEPSEALVLGGKTACLHEGKVLQFGSTLDLYTHPQKLQSARTFSDPPLNTAELVNSQNQFSLLFDPALTLFERAGFADGSYSLGVRPHHLKELRKSEADIEVSGEVTVTELSGSESFIHFSCYGKPWVALLHGICPYQSGDKVNFFIDPEHCFLFNSEDICVS